MRLTDVAESIRVRANVGEQRGTYVALQHFVAHDARLTGRGDAADIRSVTLRFKAGDVLFGALRPGQGKLAVADRPGVCSNEILVLRAKGSVGLLLAWLLDPAFLTWCEGASRGTRMPRVRWQDMARHRRSDVRADVARYAEAVDLVQRRLHVLHQRDASVLQLMQATATALRRPGSGPTLAQVVRRLPESRQATIAQPLIHLTDMDPGQPAVHRWRHQAPQGSYTPVQPGDLLVGRLRPEIPKAAVCPVQGVCTPELWVLRPHSGWSTVSLAHCTRSSTVQRMIDSASGTRMPRARWSAISGMRTGFSEESATQLEQLMRPAMGHLAHSPLLGQRLRQLRADLVRYTWRASQRATRTTTG